MADLDLLSLTRDAVMMIVKVSGPALLLGLVVGTVIALVQAIVQVNEMTLTFVPKLIVLFVTMIIFMPFMLATIIKFTEYIFDQIVAGGR